MTLSGEASDVPLEPLERDQAHQFSEWPVAAVPLVAAGVYTIWRGAEFVYAGMSARGATAESIAALDPERPWGLWTRLHTHALGRRSGDQFAVYMCDRFVLPTLTQEEFRLIGEGRLSLDLKTRELVRESLAFCFNHP